MTTNYVTTHGVIWGEISSTGVTTSYGCDALGSVRETYGAGAIQNTYRYKPYGGPLTKTGSQPDPGFLWNGGNGYRATFLPYAEEYVRMRHYSFTSSAWTTRDLLWPNESAMGYVSGNPVTLMDRSGLSPTNSCQLKAFHVLDSGYNCPDPIVYFDRLHPDYNVAEVMCYRFMTFLVTSRCPPGKSFCLGACGITQERLGSGCYAGLPLGDLCTYGKWVDDTPYPQFANTCSPPFLCDGVFEAIDTPGYYLPSSVQFSPCPASFEVKADGLMFSWMPYEYSQKFRTFANCPNSSSKYDWEVNIRVFQENGKVKVQTGSDALAAMSLCAKSH